jgi:hypothetical protein
VKQNGRFATLARAQFMVREVDPLKPLAARSADG